MNLDNDKDYFLHDFENKPETDPDRTPEPGENVEFTADKTEEQPRRRGCRRGWIIFFLIVLAALGITFYLRYCTPYVTDSRVNGYITAVERRGIIFKTFEGEMISRAALEDSTTVYTRDLSFTIPDDSLAMLIQSYQGTGRPVTVTLERYYGMLPWRGASTTVAVAVKPM